MPPIDISRQKNRVPLYRYLLGSEPAVDVELRNLPLVTSNDADPFNRLERAKYPGTASFYLAQNFADWMEDDIAQFISSQFVEDVLLAVVLPDEFSYTVIFHGKDDIHRWQQASGTRRQRAVDHREQEGI